MTHRTPAQHTDRTPAQHAIHAARNRLNWGRNAARLYCIHRQVPLGLYRLACQLQAVRVQTVNAGGGISCSEH